MRKKSATEKMHPLRQSPGETWIWTGSTTAPSNSFVRFRRSFRRPGADVVLLRISADSRYWLYLNGEYLGAGPVRGWPNHWKYDEYRLSRSDFTARNVLAVLVNHFGEGTMQYLPAPPGLWVNLAAQGLGGSRLIVAANGTWKCSPSAANIAVVPRIDAQEGFEEQFDARKEDDWVMPGYDDRPWPRAVAVTPPHASLAPRGIPPLTRELVGPQRFLRVERVRPATHVWTLRLKRFIAPGDLTSNICFVKGYLFTQVWSKSLQLVTLLRPHNHTCEFKVNGRSVSALASGMTAPLQPQTIRLRAGWNRLLFPYPSLEASADGVKPAGAVHLPQFTLTVASRRPLRWAATGRRGGPAWAFVGPFAFTAAEREAIAQHMDYPHVAVPAEVHSSADPAVYAKIYESGGADDRLVEAGYFRGLSEADICRNDVAAQAFADEPVGPGRFEGAELLLSNGPDWAELHPGAKGEDVRLLVDFGSEVVGHHVFEIEADAGVMLDFHNFEFIQADGLENYADGMNNSFRYVCRAGRQRFRTLQRRGFRFSWLIARNCRRPIRLRRLHVEFSTYPQARRGAFSCSDALLNRLWETGAHTLRCCAEDTYTDCPSYEQTHWVGDARNEALVDAVANGDSRLWFRCLEQAAQSLERAPLVLSHVPSAWRNILPAWSFFWMRSCREYLLWTGDYRGARALLPWVVRNVDGLERHLNARGLFEIQAWNMFDWAAMDTPSRGVITHNNCLAVVALRECAQLAEWLGRRRVASRFRALGRRLAEAVNRHLWDPRCGAYIDSIHADGTRSRVFSQQTQVAALIAGVATGARERRCRQLVRHAPDGFVKAGSPFFEFFLLEVLAREGREREFLDIIRRDWGFMIAQGATTFWEMWSLKTGRLTRSHCHGWSAAPTFFLSSEVLGVRPAQPGFAECILTPKLGDLKFARGVVPTPRGPISVQCSRQGKAVWIRATLPAGVMLRKAGPVERHYHLELIRS